MVIEIARFQVAPEQQKGFFGTFAEVKAYVEKAEVYQSHVISQEIEVPSRISLLVEWRSQKDHVELFESSEAHEIFINARMPFLRVKWRFFTSIRSSCNSRKFLDAQTCSKPVLSEPTATKCGYQALCGNSDRSV